MHIQRLLIYILLFLVNSATVAETLSGYPLKLSLNEAILLAVRENPSVQRSQLDLVMQKFALQVQQWQFQPHFAFQVTRGYTNASANGFNSTTNVLNVQPAVALNTAYGTQVSLTNANNIGKNYNPALTLQVVQPLMRGFGKPIVEAALYNAMDSEKVTRLNVEGTLRTTVTSVINAYLDVVTAENQLKIDQEALERTKTSVEQTKLFIKAGHKAGVELVTVEASVASAQSKIESDKNALDQARYALLTTIGIDPNTEVIVSSVNVENLMKKYHVPTLEESKRLVIDNDIQYQTDQITLNGSTKRALASAEDNTRWQLNLTVNDTLGNGAGSGSNAGINSLFNGDNQTKSASLTLTIPIDDQVAKQAVVNARIGLREALLALKQEKWNKETSAINNWNNIYSAQRALRFAENAETLQQKTYHISFQKYSFGLIDSLELQTAQGQLVSAQQVLIAARMSYLKSLVNLDLLIGNTLKTWDIKVRYD